MDRIVIRKITSHEVEGAMRLALDALTLNSSPYGSLFYLAIGFIPLSEEQEINGIRFTPMKYIIKR